MDSPHAQILERIERPDPEARVSHQNLSLEMQSIEPGTLLYARHVLCLGATALPLHLTGFQKNGVRRNVEC